MTRGSQLRMPRSSAKQPGVSPDYCFPSGSWRRRRGIEPRRRGAFVTAFALRTCPPRENADARVRRRGVSLGGGRGVGGAGGLAAAIAAMLGGTARLRPLDRARLQILVNLIVGPRANLGRDHVP